MREQVEAKRTFVNRREWGAFLSTLQSAAIHPKVLEIYRSSRDGFAREGASPSTWLATVPVTAAPKCPSIGA